MSSLSTLARAVMRVEAGDLRSRFTRAERRGLTQLFDSGILAWSSAGRGGRALIREPEAWSLWLARSFPAGVPAAMTRPVSRSDAVRIHRDSKAGRLPSEMVLLCGVIGSVDPELHGMDGVTLRPAAWCKFAGIAALNPSAGPWKYHGRLVIIENGECFLRAATLCRYPELHGLAIYGHGRLSLHISEWLRGPHTAAAEVIGFHDYDFAGLAEHLRIRQDIRPNCRLFVPSDLEKLLIHYGSARLVEKQQAQLAELRHRLRACPDEEVQRVLELILRHGRALEQELLLEEL